MSKNDGFIKSLKSKNEDRCTSTRLEEIKLLSIKHFMKPIFFLTTALAFALAGLIFLLVAQVTGFSSQVTDYYAPTIYAMRDFAAASSHVRMGLEKNDSSAGKHLVTHMVEERGKKWS